MGAAVMADQWKEFFYCDALLDYIDDQRSETYRSKKQKGSDNIISNGSGIAVANGLYDDDCRTG